MSEPNPELSDYIKPLYPIIKKKLVQDDEAGMFAKFKEILATLQVHISFHEILELIPKFIKFMHALVKGGKKKLTQEQVNMTEKEEKAEPQELLAKLKDPGKSTIICTIGLVKIPHALCDLGSSINVIPLKIFKELKI